MPHAFLRGPQSPRRWFCTKAAFPSRKEAREALGRMAKDRIGIVAHGIGRFVVYRCRMCSMYHHGHTS